ncbi:MAG TPA: metal-dependent hydrolase, partial [Saprospiraceae bacterium]|nr:metal-dependent hydrolase [Saprospiraceae bacterium]
ATLILTGFCAFAPDLDVLGFRFGIPYSSEWGHRGWTHSIVFAIVFGLVIGLIFRQMNRHREMGAANGVNAKIMVWLILSTLSHPLLDMLTNGGRGCALWWPFSAERIFFPFRPIQVSPMSIGDFISGWGLTVLVSEAIWIGLPCVLLVAVGKFLRFVSV